MKSHKVKFYEYNREPGGQFTTSSIREIEFSYRQINATPVFRIIVEGMDVNVKIASTDIQQSLRGKLATAYKKYKRYQIFWDKLLSINKFDNRDELVQLGLAEITE